jgi:hypothetical protein
VFKSVCLKLVRFNLSLNQVLTNMLSSARSGADKKYNINDLGGYSWVKK